MEKIKTIHTAVWKTVIIVSAICISSSLSGVSPSFAVAKESPKKAVAETSLSSENQKSKEDSLADQAKDDLKGGGKSIGSGFSKGAKVTGKAVKKTGTTVSGAFKKAGSAIRDFFLGKKEKTVEERNLSAKEEKSEEGNQPKLEEIQYDKSLDQVGDDGRTSPRASSEKNPNS